MSAAIALNEGMETVQWIPVSERLPEQYRVVLAYYNNGCMETTFFCEDETWVHSRYPRKVVTHWCELPLPPPVLGEGETALNVLMSCNP